MLQISCLYFSIVVIFYAVCYTSFETNAVKQTWLVTGLFCLFLLQKSHFFTELKLSLSEKLSIFSTFPNPLLLEKTSAFMWLVV